MKIIRSIFALVVCFLAGPIQVMAQNAQAAIEIPNLAYFGTTSLGYYVHLQGNTSPGDGGDAYFYRNGLVCSVDGMNIIKDKSGNCFFRLQKSQAAISPLAFGAKCDGVTDDAVALQATENAAGTLHVGIVYPSANNQGQSLLCKTLSVLTPSPGVDHFCQMGMNSGDSGTFVSNGRCGVVYLGPGTGAAVWELNNANGTSGIQAPTWHDMYITSTTGCIKLNDPNNGFTDDNTSQNYMLYPRADRVVCAANGIGFYCAKCFYGTIRDGQWSGGNGIGLPSIRFEGSDINVIEHNQLPQFTALNIDIIGRNTFGNGNVIKDNFLECSTGLSFIACIQTSGRSTYIKDNNIECQNVVTHATGAIRIVSPALATYIDGNVLACTNPSGVNAGLSVETDTPFVQFTNNTIAGAAFPSANFNGNSSILLYPSSIQTQLVHFGNTNEGGFPFTTYPNFPEADGSSPNLLFTTSPGAANYNVNIGGSAYAASVRISGGAYQLPAAGGGGNSLVFNSVPAAFKGTLNICIKASSTTASQQVKLVSSDGGTPIDTGTFTVTANPVWYCRNGLVFTTGATFAVVNDDTTHNGTVQLYRGTISQ